MSETEQTITQQSTQKKPPDNKKIALSLLLVTVLMFGFAFAMVPLYKLICSVTGLNSISTNSGRTLTSELDATNNAEIVSREIKVQFDGTINGNVALEFKPNKREVTVASGKRNRVSFYVKNHSDKTIVTQSIPGITPWQANKHFKKIECFCFETQTLQAGEAKDMALEFVVDTELPDDINTITLSYTIMDTNRSESLKTNKAKLPTVGSANTSSKPKLQNNSNS